jgi:hypothetical protein
VVFYITTKHALHDHIEIMDIPWDRFEDFVQGEQNNLKFPCKFTSTKEHKNFNPSNTLTHPRVNSASFLYKCSLIFKILLQNNAFGFIFVCCHSLPIGFWNVPYVKQFVF